MVDPGNSDNTLSQPIKHAIKRIGEHPHVDAIGPGKASPDGVCNISVSIRTNLPSAWRADGKSPTGVRLIEPVIFQFPPEYPANPPRVFLREDFNRSLPHIQPGSPCEPVEPCYLDGDPRELLHRQGIGAIVNQLVYWLERAAKDELIDLDQGWEPIRRDSIDDYAVVEHAILRQLVGKQSQFKFLLVNHVKFIPHNKSQRPAKGYFFYGTVNANPLSINAGRLKEFPMSPVPKDGIQFGQSFAVFVSPGRLPSGRPFICDHYAPETVTNVAALIKQAHEYGCGKALEDAFSHLRRQSAKLTSNGHRIPILIILCARRPVHLIGSESDIELIPYLLDTSSPFFIEDLSNIPVSPVALRHAISQNLLRRVSGVDTVDKQIVVQLGCGSLGSKIALHMARAGLAPAILVDHRSMSPHNAARHALIPYNERFNLLWMTPKVEALSEAIQGLGQTVKALSVDAVSICYGEKPLRKVIPKKTWAVINSTASLAVRDSLAAVSSRESGARIIETSLFADGLVGIMTIEGPNRNPNTADLILEAYEFIRSNNALCVRFFSTDGSLVNHEIGQGCASATMIMPDADISLFSASMAHRLLDLRRNDFPDTGQILIGERTNDGMGLEWSTEDIGPYHVLRPENDHSWEVRVSPRVHNKITEECLRYSNVETGGIIMGAISETRKTITIINTIPAPEDSKRSATSFVLGTKGVSQMVEEYAATTGYALHCLGSWHSHLNDTGGSARDYKTASIISTKVPSPLALLIKTPASYRAILAT